MNIVFVTRRQIEFFRNIVIHKVGNVDIFVLLKCNQCELYDHENVVFNHTTCYFNYMVDFTP